MKKDRVKESRTKIVARIYRTPELTLYGTIRKLTGLVGGPLVDDVFFGNNVSGDPNT